MYSSCIKKKIDSLFCEYDIEKKVFWNDKELEETLIIILDNISKAKKILNKLKCLLLKWNTYEKVNLLEKIGCYIEIFGKSDKTTCLQKFFKCWKNILTESKNDDDDDEKCSFSFSESKYCQSVSKSNCSEFIENNKECDCGDDNEKIKYSLEDFNSYKNKIKNENCLDDKTEICQNSFFNKNSITDNYGPSDFENCLDDEKEICQNSFFNENSLTNKYGLENGKLNKIKNSGYSKCMLNNLKSNFCKNFNPVLRNFKDLNKIINKYKNDFCSSYNESNPFSIKNINNQLNEILDCIEEINDILKNRNNIINIIEKINMKFPGFLKQFPEFCLKIRSYLPPGYDSSGKRIVNNYGKRSFQFYFIYVNNNQKENTILEIIAKNNSNFDGLMEIINKYSCDILKYEKYLSEIVYTSFF